MSLSVSIHDVAFGGKGVARHDGKVYFVPFTAPGDEAKIHVTRDKKKFAEAVVTELVSPAPERVTPPCPYFGKCGGCAYQHIEYSHQVALKHRQVEQTLKRVGRLENVPMRDAVSSPKPYEYRNRIRVHVLNGITGFFAHESHNLVEIKECRIADKAVNESLARFRKRSVPDGDYVISAGDRGRFFEQTNDGVADALLALVGANMPDGRRLLVDAYCGAGFFAKQFTKRFAEVIGIEQNELAVGHARKAAASNERYLAGDVAVMLGEVLSANDPASTVVILDPPAAGLEPRVADILLATSPADILYISCNPATLARDLSLLKGRYQIESVTPLDMFPQTAEIEVFVKLKLV